MSVELSVLERPQQPRGADERRRREPLRVGQSVPGRGDDDQPVAQKRLGDHRRDVLAIGHRRPQRDVDGAVGQQRREVLAARHRQVDLDALVAVAEDAEQGAGGELGEGRCRRDAQRRLLALGLVDRASRLVLEVEDGARRARQAPTARRQLDDAPRPHVQRIAELASQCSNRARYRRLRDPERLRCGLYGAEPSDRKERPKLGKSQLSDRFIWLRTDRTAHRIAVGPLSEERSVTPWQCRPQRPASTRGPRASTTP